MTEMPEHERPLTEQFRIVALKYVDADAAARMLEETKTTTLERMKSDLIAERGEMPDNKAERLVKSGDDWTEYLARMVNARTESDKLKLHLEFIRMQERYQDRMSWLDRSERKMGRSVT